MMNGNRIPKDLLQELFKIKPKSTIYRYISKKLVSLNGAVTRRVAALLVAKDLGIKFLKYVNAEDRKELAPIPNVSARLKSDGHSRTIEKMVTKEIRPLKGITSFDPYLPPALLEEAKEMAEKAYPWLYVFENSVRNIIQILMAKKHGLDWWEKRIKKPHKTIDDNVNKRMADEMQDRWHSSRRGVHKINYTDIDDLRIIVQDNWAVFSIIHKRQSWVIEHISQLSYSRNIIAHNNPLRERDIRSIQTKITEWFEQIKTLPA
jgi:hypothetical protein